MLCIYEAIDPKHIWLGRAAGGAFAAVVLLSTCVCTHMHAVVHTGPVKMYGCRQGDLVIVNAFAGCLWHRCAYTARATDAQRLQAMGCHACSKYFRGEVYTSTCG